jgi:hypothetical protein
MKRIAHASLLLLILIGPATTLSATRARIAATCTGATPCRACKNCRYCKHCAREGGKCGVCRRRAEAVARKQGGWEDAQERLASAAH